MAEALLEMAGTEGLSPEFIAGSLCRVAGDGRGLLYAKSAISVKPARSRVRSAAVVSGGRVIVGGWAGPCALVFIIRGLVYQCAELKIHGLV